MKNRISADEIVNLGFLLLYLIILLSQETVYLSNIIYLKQYNLTFCELRCILNFDSKLMRQENETYRFICWY